VSASAVTWKNLLSLDLIKEINMRYFIALFALMGVVGLSACNTVQGMGKDIEKAGESIKKAGS
jgi:entericidin B